MWVALLESWWHLAGVGCVKLQNACASVGRSGFSSRRASCYLASSTSAVNTGGDYTNEDQPTKH